jgi:ABC-2 type transport system permease protein
MIEVMTTSISPVQLVGGKAIGLLGVVLSQLLVWTFTVVVGLVIAAQLWAPVRAIQIPWSLLLIVIAYFIPSYALVTGIMTAIGISMTELREAQQVGGIVNMLFILPLFFTVAFFTDPSGPLMIGLTLFPTTAFITLAMRWGISIVPVWQLLLSWTLLVSTAVWSVWAAARIFRTGMLRYGQPLDLGTIRGLLRLDTADSVKASPEVDIK